MTSRPPSHQGVVRRLGALNSPQLLRVLRFLISGGSAAAVEYAAFIALQLWLGSGSLQLSQSVSFGCGFVVSFLLNRHWVFQSAGNAGQELAKYALLAAINLGLGNLSIFLMVSKGHLDPLIAKIAVMGLIAAWNYLIFSRLVFRKQA